MEKVAIDQEASRADHARRADAQLKAAEEAIKKAVDAAKWKNKTVICFKWYEKGERTLSLHTRDHSMVHWLCLVNGNPSPIDNNREAVGARLSAKLTKMPTQEDNRATASCLAHRKSIGEGLLYI